MKFKKIYSYIKKKIKDFLHDEYAGNLVEYVLLIGFALFMFLILISLVSTMFDWTLGQSNDFFNFINQLKG